LAEEKKEKDVEVKKENSKEEKKTIE